MPRKLVNIFQSSSRANKLSFFLKIQENDRYYKHIVVFFKHAYKQRNVHNHLLPAICKPANLTFVTQRSQVITPLTRPAFTHTLPGNDYFQLAISHPSETATILTNCTLGINCRFYTNKKLTDLHKDTFLSIITYASFYHRGYLPARLACPNADNSRCFIDCKDKTLL